jgi:hypothetical protein
MQPKKARSQPPPRRSKALDDAQNAATQVLDRMEAPHQRHRGVDEIADQKIDLLKVNWMLFHEFASRLDLAVPPFQVPQRKVNLKQQVQEDARNGVSTTLFIVSKVV